MYDVLLLLRLLQRLFHLVEDVEDGELSSSELRSDTSQKLVGVIYRESLDSLTARKM
jgi:hypothetical protein